MSSDYSRRLYNNILGFYMQTCFRMHIETNITFKHMTEEDYSVLAHEYIHFLQDITTSYGAFNAYAISEFMKSVAESIRQSPDGIIDVPFTPDLGLDNVYANYCIKELTYGDSFEILRINEIVELRNEKESLESVVLDSIPNVVVLLKDGGGHVHKVNFGACAVMESMAYLMEQYIAPKKISAPDYPYRIAEIITRDYYTEFGKDTLNILALCDVALLTSAPGHTFICYLGQFKEDNWLPKDPSEIYSKVLDNGYLVSGSNPGKKSFEEEMEEMSVLAIQSLQTYFNDSMPRFRRWIEETIKRGFALRIGRKDFILDIARGGNIMNNVVLRALINDYIGTPIITNPQAEGTIKSPNVAFDSDFFLFPAVGEVFKLFDRGQCNCELKDICARNGGPVDDNCDKSPWVHGVTGDKICPYSILWHNWSFKRCKPRGQRYVSDIRQ